MKKGFTLIELLVVVLIIGVLAAIALPQYFKSVEKSRFAEADLLMGEVYKSLDRCRLQTGNYDDCFWNNMDIDTALPEADGGLARQGKYFWVSLETRGNEIFGCRGDCEKDDDWPYCLYYRYSDDGRASFAPIRFCEARNELGHKVCASIGTVTTNRPDSFGYYRY